MPRVSPAAKAGDTVLTAFHEFTRCPACAGHDKAGVLPPLDLLDLVGPGAPGRDDLDGRALHLADERASERRADRDPPLLGVGFPLADDLPDPLLVGILPH